MKKITSALLALLLIFSLCTMAFAESLNISGHIFKAYQIFSGTQADGDSALASINWGSGINAEAFVNELKASTAFGDPNPFADITYNASSPATSANAVATIVKDWTDGSDEAKAFAKLAENNKVDGAGIAAKNGMTTLPAGYYLVVDETAASSNPEAYNLALLQLTNEDTFEIVSKAEVPTVTKLIKTGENTYASTNKQAIGGTEEFKIESAVPATATDYNYYCFVIKDTLSEGLDLNASTIVVKSGTATLAEGTDYTLTTGTGAAPYSFKVALKDAISHAGETITVTYTATVNEKAVVGNLGNPNTVFVTYSNKPDYEYAGTPDPGDEDVVGTTPEAFTLTYVAALRVIKEDENNKVLTDAEFTLSGTGLKTVITSKEGYVEDENGTYYKLTAKSANDEDTYTNIEPTATTASQYASTTQKYKLETVTDTVVTGTNTQVSKFVGTDGIVSFEGLDAGTYTLSESEVPAGYNSAADITFTIVWTAPADATLTKSSECTWAIDTDADSKASGVSYNTTDDIFEVTVMNQKGSVLPETGGIGTTLFYIIGSVLVVGAAVVLVTKKRMHQEDL